MAPIALLELLPDELFAHVVLQLLSPACGCDVVSAQQLSWTCKYLHEQSQPLRAKAKEEQHALRWGVKHLPTDVVLHASGRGLRAAATDANWRRAYGLPFKPHGISSWEVRIDQTQANQGLMQLGVALVSRVGVHEWSLSPFYGRLVRRHWDKDGNLLVAAKPPDGLPDGHLKHMLVDTDGAPTNVEGRAIGSIIEVIFDHDEGYLAFRLNGGVVGPRLEGFFAEQRAAQQLQQQQHHHHHQQHMKPVVGFRWADDQVTIRSTSGERMRNGWPQQHSDATRLRDARGLQAARALREQRPTVSLSAGLSAGGSPGVAFLLRRF